MLLETDDFFTLAEFAAQHGVGTRTVYSWLRQKIAPAHEYFFGGYFFCKKAALEFTPPYKTRGYKTGNKQSGKTAARSKSMPKRKPRLNSRKATKT